MGQGFIPMQHKHIRAKAKFILHITGECGNVATSNSFQAGKPKTEGIVAYQISMKA